MSKADIRVSRHLQTIAKNLSKDLEKAAGQRMAFSLIVFSDAEDGETNYVSNCARKDAAKSLQKVLERWQQRELIDVPAHHKN